MRRRKALSNSCASLLRRDGSRAVFRPVFICFLRPPIRSPGHLPAPSLQRSDGELCRRVAKPLRINPKATQLISQFGYCCAERRGNQRIGLDAEQRPRNQNPARWVIGRRIIIVSAASASSYAPYCTRFRPEHHIFVSHLDRRFWAGARFTAEWRGGDIADTAGGGTPPHRQKPPGRRIHRYIM